MPRHPPADSGLSRRPHRTDQASAMLRLDTGPGVGVGQAGQRHVDRLGVDVLARCLAPFIEASTGAVNLHKRAQPRKAALDSDEPARYSDRRPDASFRGEIQRDRGAAESSCEVYRERIVADQYIKA